MIMCWLTPKSLEGSSEKFVIDKSGLSSQLSGNSEDEDVENEEDDLVVVTLHSRRDVEALVFAESRPL